MTPPELTGSTEFTYEDAPSSPLLLFIDEIESFLRSRDSGSNTSEDVKIVNTLLTQLVEIRRHRAVVVAATNYLANLDAAAIREGRFDFKVEITPPAETARVGLMQKAASKYGHGLDIDQDALLSAAKRWNGFSVSRLLAVGKELPKYAREQVACGWAFVAAAGPDCSLNATRSRRSTPTLPTRGRHWGSSTKRMMSFAIVGSMPLRRS